jgi:hypothetical protein
VCRIYPHPDGSLPGKTNLAEGIYTAQQELDGPRHIIDNVPVIILLSDGRSNIGGDPIVAAEEAKAAGSRIFVIGLGDDADTPVLSEIASSPEDYFYAPDPEDLASIYDKIVRNVACETPSSLGVRPENPKETMPSSLLGPLLIFSTVLRTSRRRRAWSTMPLRFGQNP